MLLKEIVVFKDIVMSIFLSTPDKYLLGLHGFSVVMKFNFFVYIGPTSGFKVILTDGLRESTFRERKFNGPVFQ